MIKEKQNLVKELFNRTSYLLNLLKSQASQEEIYFLPVGMLLLKWLNDSKARFNWETTVSYKDIINICEDIRYNDQGTNEIYSIAECIENNNPMLDGIFTDLCFSNLNYVKPEYIKDIVMAYSDFEFNNIDSEKYITGPFIELFLQKLSDDLSSYSFITPKSIKELLAKLFIVHENINISDITCGTGGILSEIANECNYRNLDVNTINLYGQEINFKVALIGRINLLLHGIVNSKILIKDSLKEPIFNEKSYMNNTDIILSNLPLGLKWSINEIGYRNDFKYDIPSTMNADWLFIQRGISSLNNCGRAAFIVSKGTLTRKTEMNIRKYILKDDLVEAVVSLPSNLYGSRTMPIEILILNKNKDISLKNRVLFIDASKHFYKKERGKNDLKPKHVDKILNVYYNSTDIDGYSKLVDLSMIEKYNFELDSSIYINNSLTDLKDAKMKILSNVADIKRGLQLSKNDIENNMNKANNSYYYIKISDINDDEIEFNEKVGNLSDSKINSYELKPNDILLSARGTLIKLALYKENMYPSVFSGNILLIRVKPDYNPYFLKFYLSSPKGRELISSMQGGSTIISLNPNKLKDMLVPDISLDEQNELAERIQSNEKNYKQRILQAKNIYDQNLKAIDEEINYYINC